MFGQMAMHLMVTETVEDATPAPGDGDYFPGRFFGPRFFSVRFFG